MKLAGHVVRRVDATHAREVQALFALDPEYWVRAEGGPLRPEEATITLAEGPPGFALDKKHAFLVDDVALLDMLEGYPDAETWFLGLIFVAPHARGSGFGTRLLDALFAHVREHGGTKLRLAVTTTNPHARRLYERLGFTFVVQKPRTTYTGTVLSLDVLERAL